MAGPRGGGGETGRGIAAYRAAKANAAVTCRSLLSRASSGWSSSRWKKRDCSDADVPELSPIERAN
ncbi:MAG TPA: hypothetical protein VMP01_10040 [Pirellulaceae bacterium]|nr:hypothetical protein [Pirellulaceae bacterium]